MATLTVRREKNEMKISRIAGLVLLLVVWLSLCVWMLVASGFTLYNLLIVTISGIIVFVPLWKKYFK